MPEKQTDEGGAGIDRMGQLIGQLRVRVGVSLNQLAQGLCALSYLNKIENGKREADKQLTDALFQRLGKPVELFERILDWDEFQQWRRRQAILCASSICPASGTTMRSCRAAATTICCAASWAGR